jgi:hypothetical protein
VQSALCPSDRSLLDRQSHSIIMQRKTVLLCSCVTSVLVRLTLSEESVGGLYSNKLRIFIDVLDERLQGDPLQNISPKYDSPLSSKLLHRIETSAPQMDLPILLSVWNRLLRKWTLRHSWVRVGDHAARRRAPVHSGTGHPSHPTGGGARIDGLTTANPAAERGNDRCSGCHLRQHSPVSA